MRDEVIASEEPLLHIPDNCAMSYHEYAELKGWDGFDFGKCSFGESAYYAMELARHGFSCQGRRILELGFGNGMFLRFARDSGAEVVGVEIQDDLLKRAADRGFVVYRSLDQVLESAVGKNFDLAVAFDVLEHLSPEETVETFRKMQRLVKPDTGLFIARFPNGDSPFSLPLQNGDYTHRIALGAGIVSQILARGGWKINYLGEPMLTPATFRERMLLSPAHVFRRALERLLIALYYGRHGPSTLYHNYILVASPNMQGDDH